MLASTFRRAAQPVLVTFGHEREEGRLRVGLLFISAQLDERTYHLSDPDTGERVSVLLPASLANLPSDTMRTRVTLEVAP